MNKRRTSVVVGILAMAASVNAGSFQTTEWFGPQVERLWTFVQSAYSMDLPQSPSRIAVEMAGRGGPLVPRMVTFSFSRPAARQNQQEEEAASITFFCHGGKLVGLGASGTIIRVATPADPASRAKRKAAAIEALRDLFGWGAAAPGRLSVDGTIEFVAFSGVESEDLPPGATTASFDPVSGMLLSAGMI